MYLRHVMSRLKWGKFTNVGNFFARKQEKSFVLEDDEELILVEGENKSTRVEVRKAERLEVLENYFMITNDCGIEFNEEESEFDEEEVKEIDNFFVPSVLDFYQMPPVFVGTVYTIFFPNSTFSKMTIGKEGFNFETEFAINEVSEDEVFIDLPLI